MSLWTDMTSAALVGTGRAGRPAPLPAGWDEFATAADAPVEEALLRAAAVWSAADVVARASSPVEMPVPSADAADGEDTVMADTEFAALLRPWIADREFLLLREACEKLGAAQRTLPPRLIPAMLELGRSQTMLRGALRGALGRLGEWLAMQNPDWKYALGAGREALDLRLWEEGDVQQRATYLRERRATQPAEARELVKKSFPSDAARDRAILLPAIAVGLSLEDEAFLQDLLTQDRSKEVRAVAARLLSRLPESAFSKRMAGALAELFSGAKWWGKSWKVEPPETYRPEWKADGIEEKPPAGIKLGERAWWLRQLVANAPLSWWTEGLKQSPAEILKTAAASDWKDALLAGFRDAAAAQCHRGASVAVWAPALIDAGVLPNGEVLDFVLELDPALANESLEKWVMGLDQSVFVAQIIQRADFPWSLGLWRAFERRLSFWLATRDWTLRSVLKMLACRVPPGMLQQKVSLPAPPIQDSQVQIVGETAEEKKDFYVETRLAFDQTLEARRKLHQLLPGP